ncbi:MAG: hypothetical protein JJ932_11170 [Balneolaceae bacterium]|nr:hypothetical protein [Balneolaceae bacterium]MBO6648342.1 hypothetical protein [Balneolaceae bacterium]
MQSYRRNAPSAGPVAFPKLKNSINSDTFAKEVLNKKDVLLLPASIYNYEPSFFRVGFGKSTMRKSLSVFGEFMQDLHKSV